MHHVHLASRHIRALAHGKCPILAAHADCHRPGEDHHTFVLTGVYVAGNPATRIETHLYLEKFSARVLPALQEGQVLARENVVEMLVRGHRLSLCLGQSVRKVVVVGRHAPSGRVVDTAGDGVLAVFDGPTRAVNYASAVIDAVHELGHQVRAGVHTGEVERREANALAGMAVHIGARVSGNARADEVLVTGTVRDLTLGSGLTFVDRGEHELKGVPDRWHLYALLT